MPKADTHGAVIQHQQGAQPPTQHGSDMNSAWLVDPEEFRAVGYGDGHGPMA
jgi:hypothetical protein